MVCVRARVLDDVYVDGHSMRCVAVHICDTLWIGEQIRQHDIQSLTAYEYHPKQNDKSSEVIQRRYSTFQLFPLPFALTSQHMYINRVF